MPSFSISGAFAADFSARWFDVWNRHALPDILALFSDEIAFASPKIIARNLAAEGWLYGKTALASYWGDGLKAAPDLRFQPLQCFRAPSSITLTYRASTGSTQHDVAEVFLFNPVGLVEKAMAHHA